MENIILDSMKNTINFLRDVKKVEDVLDSVGLSLELFEGHGNPLEEYVNNNINLIWALILRERDCPELDSDEFDAFEDLLYSLAYDNKYSGYDIPEDIYNYFMNTDTVIADLNIGKED